MFAHTPCETSNFTKISHNHKQHHTNHIWIFRVNSRYVTSIIVAFTTKSHSHHEVREIFAMFANANRNWGGSGKIKRERSVSAKKTPILIVTVIILFAFDAFSNISSWTENNGWRWRSNRSRSHTPILPRYDSITLEFFEKNKHWEERGRSLRSFLLIIIVSRATWSNLNSKSSNKPWQYENKKPFFIQYWRGGTPCTIHTSLLPIGNSPQQKGRRYFVFHSRWKFPSFQQSLFRTSSTKTWTRRQCATRS